MGYCSKWINISEDITNIFIKRTLSESDTDNPHFLLLTLENSYKILEVRKNSLYYGCVNFQQTGTQILYLWKMFNYFLAKKLN